MNKIIAKIFKKSKNGQENTKELTPEESQIREQFEKEFYFKTVWAILGTAIFLVFVFFIVFFIAVEGKEDTKVPNLEGLKLHEAIIKLQERALYPKLSVKTSTPDEKGIILTQDISPGSVVKAGKLIGLMVSLGGVIDTVGDYEGQTIDAARAELKKIFASSKPLLIIVDPIYIESDEPKGTILSQFPKAGTEITQITELQFHVSKGVEQSSFIVPTMKGLRFDVGFAKISRWPIRYRITVGKTDDNKQAGKIIKQIPEPGKKEPWTTIVEMVIAKPTKFPSDYAFGIFELVIPDYAVSVPMTIEKLKTDGVREIIVETRTFGGALTIPYLEEVGTEIIISVKEEKVKSFTVRQQ